MTDEVLDDKKDSVTITESNVGLEVPFTGKYTAQKFFDYMAREGKSKRNALLKNLDGTSSLKKEKVRQE